MRVRLWQWTIKWYIFFADLCYFVYIIMKSYESLLLCWFGLEHWEYTYIKNSCNVFGGTHDEIGILKEGENCNSVDNECWADVGLTEKDVDCVKLNIRG